MEPVFSSGRIHWYRACGYDAIAEQCGAEPLVFGRKFMEQGIRREGDVLFFCRDATGIHAAEARVQNCRAELEKAQQELEDTARRHRAYTGELAEQVWRKTAALRLRFADALRQYPEPAVFLRKIAATIPRYDDLTELAERYRRAFGKPPVPIAPRILIPDVSVLDAAAESPLLAEPVISHSSRFAGELPSAEWVMQGYHKYTIHPEKCPYCAQDMPAQTAQALSALFTGEYTRKLRALRSLYELLRANVRAVLLILRQNLQEPAPFADFSAYRAHIAELEQAAYRNLAAVQQKLEDPRRIVRWVALRPMLEQLNRDICVLNQAAERQNIAAQNRREQQKACTEQILGYLSYTTQDTTGSYADTAGRFAAEEKTAKQAVHAARTALQAAENLADSRRKFPTSAELNRLLAENGLTAFSFRDGTQAGTCKLIREAGTTPGAGEMQLIGFLYFCWQALADVPRILVADDPFAGLGDTEAAAVFRMACSLADSTKTGRSAGFFLLSGHAQYCGIFRRRYAPEVLP